MLKKDIIMQLSKTIKLLVCAVIFTIKITAQQKLPEIKIQANKTLALVEFVKSVSTSRSGFLKKHFEKSELNTKEIQELLKEYDNLQLGRSIRFDGYPTTRRNATSTLDIFTVMASNASNLESLKKSSIGLFQLKQHRNLFKILKKIEPVYDAYFWNKNQTLINTKIASLKKFAKEHNLNELYTSMMRFYNSSWDSDLPLVISVVPYPKNVGFSATVRGNVLVSGLPLDMNYYNIYFGVMMHEIGHILYEQQSPKVQYDIEDWFLNSKSIYKNYTYNWFNEVLATVVGNGWVYENLAKKTDADSWYHNYQINTLAKAIYPKAKYYLKNKKAIDKEFIDYAILKYKETLSKKHFSYDNLCTYLEVMLPVNKQGAEIDNKFMNAIFSYFDTRSIETFSSYLCGEKLSDFKKSTKTKIIAITEDNKANFKKLKLDFPFIKEYKFNLKKDFVIVHTNKNGQVFIVMNLQNKNFEKVFKILKEKGKLTEKKKEIFYL